MTSEVNKLLLCLKRDHMSYLTLLFILSQCDQMRFIFLLIYCGFYGVCGALEQTNIPVWNNKVVLIGIKVHLQLL